ncbi:MAG TPA: N-acetylmuramoyl-L-alanine amidase [Myxococcaceae bacterium]|nr:N-acetylmuramoyl-L-alanine amidase [Myxococcaceae bacterium]
MTLRITFLLLSLLLPLAAQAKRDAAEDAYEEARKAYYSLKGDAARRKLRHHWLNVARKFEAVASHHPKSARAPDALYTAGELLNELSRISFVAEDRQGAIDDYTRLIESHPRHRLSDDAALSLARMYFERMDQPEAARRVLTDILKANSRGDRARELKALLASLPPPPRAPARKAPAPKAEEGNSSLLDAIHRHARKPDLSKAAQKQASEAPKAEPKPLPVVRVELSKPVEPPAAEPPKPVTAPVDEQVAEARLKAVAKVSKEAELTLAEQLGLKVRRVVIDAGHGGHDSGAVSRKGLKEKDVTLAISQKLARELRNRGLEVVLTRDDDRYLKLEDRAQMANQARGDLFISIHCNSAPTSKLRGIETYTLNTSADRYSIRLAARENASSEKGISDLQFILADLATKANTEESSRLAHQVQKNLVGHLSRRYKQVKNLGTKEALFYVLLGTKMPAILVETSFLSHPEEAKRLGSEKYQDDVARAIAEGVEEFLGSRHKLAQVD